MTYGIGQGATMAMSMRTSQVSRALGSRLAPTSLPKLAGRVPQRWRRRVPMRLRNALVARFGHPAASRSTRRRIRRG